MRDLYRMIDDASIYTGKKRQLDTVDYVLLSLLFIISAVIGFYYAWKDRKQKSTQTFHLGNGHMHPFPVSLSLTSSFISAMGLLGIPAEIYTHGTMFMWIMAGMLIASGGAAHIFLPTFYGLGKVSCFEYLELRFGKVVRMLACLSYLLQSLTYMGFVLYAPSLAFEAVTGVSLWVTMIGVAAVCTLYTALGGMKTVLLTHVLQFLVMIAGLICLLTFGSEAAGGFSNAWTTANDNDRIKFADFSVDPKTRHSVWTVAIGGSFLWMYLYGTNQVQVQQYLTLPSLERAQVAIWLNYPGLVLVFSLLGLIGVVMFAFYQTCHPVTLGIIFKNDQLIPLFMLDVLGQYRGLTGVFLACVFSGSLSSLSSGLNAMSTIIFEDFVKLLLDKDTFVKRGLLLSKGLVLLVGCIQFCVAVAISSSDSLILQFCYSLYSIFAGPIFGIFIAGMFFPWTNKTGAMVGFVFSLLFMFWLGIGSLIEKPSTTEIELPLYTNGCYLNYTLNTTSVSPNDITTVSLPTEATTKSNSTTSDEPILWNFYRMSYLWYTGLGMIICVIISLIVSFMTGYTKPETLDSRLMCPFIERIFPCLPESIKKPFRFGVNYDKTSQYNKEAGQNNNGFEGENEQNNKIILSTKL